MSTPTPNHQGDTSAAPNGGNDSSFDSFIDSNLILEASSPAPTTPTRNHHRDVQKLKVAAPLLPTRLSEVSNLDSPTASEFLHYPHASSSNVNTPTTSNPSNLHNLNFDFFDGHGNTTSTSEHSSFTSEADANSSLVTSFGDDSNASSHVFSWNATNTPSLYPIPLTHSFTRSVDDLEHNIGSQHAIQYHQRSLSLRDVAPPPSTCDGILTESLTTLPFPLVKMEHELTSQFTGSFIDNAPSPITEDRSSPSTSAVSSSLFEHGSPRHDKKRRLASPSESMTSTHSNKSSKSTSMARSSTGTTKKATAATNRRSRANTLTSKANHVPAAPSPPATTGLGFSPASLIENISVASSGPPSGMMLQVDSEATLQQPSGTVSHSSPQATFSLAEKTELPLASHIRSNSSSTTNERDGSVAPKSNNKRPPPSASQITESGQPFPVIDTSAKHSSLFVPPDTSGLTKREARLVKNRAAAFLSRQRKREQFEELEVKCKSLCRLVWRFWEIVAGPNHEVSFAEKYSQTRILSIVLEEEVDEVREVLEMVVALKGGSVAPTEDGQMQGAISAGIPSANGKIATPFTASESKQTTGRASVGAEKEMSEIAKLRAELEESKKREGALQAELAQERSLRMTETFDHEARKPFRCAKQEEALSLTISPKYQGDEVEIEEECGLSSLQTEDGTRRKIRGRGNARQGPSRTSERLQRQQSQVALTSANTAANGGQRKAAGAALMMVLFSFALFGLPGGQVPRVGGMTKVGNAEEFSVGKVLGAPLSGNAPYNQEEDEEMVDYDLTGTQAPSSHLSAKDLMPEMSDLLNLEANQDEVEALLRQQSPNRSIRNLLGNSHRDDEDSSVDYQAFARDLGASLDWDVQRGFIVIGSEHDRDEETKDSSSAQEDAFKENAKSKDESDAPTKLTLFVPAPDLSGDVLEAEDRFYDAPLASAEAVPTKASSPSLGIDGKEEEAKAKDLTQAEATKAALRVLRNHRIAQEAAALATSRNLGNKKPYPSHRVETPPCLAKKEQANDQKMRSDKVKKHDNDQEGEAADDVKVDSEASEEQDYSREVMAASSTTDKIRGTDFYQLEFSLSGAKVRNVAELAKLLGVVRNKN